MRGWQPDVRPGDSVPAWRARKKREAAAAAAKPLGDPKGWGFTYCRRCRSGTALKCFPVKWGGAVLWLCERRCFGEFVVELAGETKRGKNDGKDIR